MTPAAARPAGYVVRRIAPAREPVLDRLAGASRRFQVHALVELDVTVAAQRIAAAHDTISWTGFVIGSVARAVALHPALNVRRAGHQLVCFDRVDVGVTVERGSPDLPVLDLALVPAADRLGCAEITALLHQAKSGRRRRTRPPAPWRHCSACRRRCGEPGSVPSERGRARRPGSALPSASPHSGCSPTPGAGPSPSPR